MAKFTTFIIGLIIAGMTSVVFFNFMGSAINNYNITSNDTSEIAVYNQLDDIVEESESIRERATNISDKSGFIDVIGGYFSDAYSAVRITAASVDTFENMTNALADQTGVITGENSKIFRVGLTTIVIIIIIVGILLSTITKREL